MVVELITANGHLLALIAQDLLMGALVLLMLIKLCLFDSFATRVYAEGTRCGAINLDVALKFIKWDVCPIAAIWAPERRLIYDFLYNEVQLR